MADGLSSIGESASKLSKSPLGIIALFIVLVYGIAAIIAGFSISGDQTTRTVLVLFIVIFPLVVLASFLYLVVKHSDKLYAPADFKDESNYVRLKEIATASIATASIAAAESLDDSKNAGLNVEEIVRAVQSGVTAAAVHPEQAPNALVLWVDDEPLNNRYERRAFEAMGLRFSLALSTEQAVEQIRRHNFTLVITDMNRGKNPLAGLDLVNSLKETGLAIPVVVYSSNVISATEILSETEAKNIVGICDGPSELFELVMRFLVTGRA